MEYLKSLRDYIDRLKACGEIQEIDLEVDWDLEMGAIIRRSYELRAPAPLFYRIKGIEPGFRVLGAPAGLSGQKGKSLIRLAVSLGLPESATARDLVEALVNGHDRTPIPPRRVATGPCKEHKWLGAEIDLTRLPAPMIHEGDGGRYLNTWGTVVVRTPDGRWTNWSITRIMLAGKNTLAGAVIPTQHLGIIHREWKALDRPMPFALAVGTPPVVPFVSGMPLDENVNEADFIGGYMGQPLEVVDCETVDLQVPATSEIVIEGTVAPRDMVPEGPMGEYSGYLSPGGGMPSPEFQVTALTYRTDPILPVVAAGEPVEENHTCWGLAVSAQLLWELRRQGFPATMCWSPFESAAHWLVVSVDGAAAISRGRGQMGKDLAEVLFRTRAGSLIPKVILVDDAVDATDLDEVTWAFATRCHPVKDHVLVPDQRVLPLVAFLTPGERKAARGTKVIYNCLPADDGPPDQASRRSSFRFLWPREIQQRVVQNWRRYGYGDS
jgi:4-hydroxy-3-polyprenylbenzoate decarboxylase